MHFPGGFSIRSGSFFSIATDGTAVQAVLFVFLEGRNLQAVDCRVFAPRKEPLLLSAVNDSVVRISPPSRWNGAPTTARKHRCSLMGVLFCLGRRTEGVQVVSGKHLSVSVYANFAGREPTPDA